jgi:hypothetical protein
MVFSIWIAVPFFSAEVPGISSDISVRNGRSQLAMEATLLGVTWLTLVQVPLESHRVGMILLNTGYPMVPPIFLEGQKKPSGQPT